MSANTGGAAGASSQLENRYAVLTGSGRGAVGVVWLEGSQALDLLSRHFRPAGSPPLPARPVGSVSYGVWAHAAGNASEAEDVVVLRLRPDEFEVHIHGGRQSRQALRQTLREAGFAEQVPSDFLRVPGHGELAAMISTHLLRCETERAARWLLNQEVAWRDWLEQLDQQLVGPDFSGVVAACTQLLSRARTARHLTEPWKVVLAGEPNVGKSSLINALAGFTRAIVHSSPGTTRDVVRQRLVLDGWVIEFADTAGQRVAGSAIEARGMELAREIWRAADCRVAVTDATRSSSSFGGVWQPAPDLLIANKVEMPEARWSSNSLPVSALTRAGLEQFQAAILNVLLPAGADLTDPLPLGEVLPALLEQVLQAAKERKPAELRGGVLRLRQYCGLLPALTG